MEKQFKNMWMIVSPDNTFWLDTIRITRKETIAAFVKHWGANYLPEDFKDEFQKHGWKCVKVNIKISINN